MTDRIKANGIHYTPPELAAFLASSIRDYAEFQRGPIRVLDPACGSGSLLEAFAQTFPKRSRYRLQLTGFETDPDALKQARRRLKTVAAGKLSLRTTDFLTLDRINSQGMLFDAVESAGHKYDVVIANPPYVRTQVLGADQAQSLARQFGLTGRVDLYHAFAIAMANALRPGGTLGLLTSNRFLTIRSGESLRRFLRTTFHIQAVHDLGDTKLFAAAVLPVVVVATKGKPSNPTKAAPLFTRVYEEQDKSGAVTRYPHFLDAVRDARGTGLIQTESGCFKLERGILPARDDAGAIWSLSTPQSDDWLRAIGQSQECTIEDVAKVRVGIKTTADKVFVRNEWESLPGHQRPEAVLLRRLITHHEASRWLASRVATKQVLYPHLQRDGKRAPIDLSRYPRAKAYLESHEETLRARKYVIDGGRRWYEIWVPHEPAGWDREKVVFPDISEEPRFFYDPGGSVVQGDCYWIVTKENCSPDWLLVILAVCNSTLATKFYDTAFHNKLYSGRRRFMTQFVKQFPLPPLQSRATKKLIQHTKRLLDNGATTQAERAVNALVWEAFDLVEA